MAILDSGADFLYSDEALFKKSIRRPMVAHFKPDFAPDYLVCCNYICHLSAFKRSLYFEAGVSAASATAARTTTCSCA